MRQPSLFETHSSCESDAPATVHPPSPVGKAGVVHPRRITRRSHPETSLMAAADTIESGRFKKHEEWAVDLVRRYPGRTAAELDRIAGVSDRRIGKRLGGLANKYRLRRGKRRVCQEKGRQCVTWFLQQWNWKWVRLTFPIKSQIRKRRWTKTATKSPTDAGTWSAGAG